MKSGTHRRIDKGFVKDLLKKVRLGSLVASWCSWSVALVLFAAPLLAAPSTPRSGEGTQLCCSEQGNSVKPALEECPVPGAGNTLTAGVNPSNIMVAQGWHPASPAPASPVQDPLCAQFLRLFLQKEKDVDALQPLVNLLRNEENNVELHSKAAEDHKEKAKQAYEDVKAKAGVVKTMIYTYCLPFKEDGQEAVPALAGVQATAISLSHSPEAQARITAANDELEHEFEEILNKHIPNAEREKIATEQAKTKVLQLRDELRMRKRPIRDFIIDWYQRAPNCLSPSTDAINNSLDTLKNRLPDPIEKDVENLEQKAKDALDETRAFRDKARFLCYEYAKKLPALCELSVILTKRPDKANIRPGEKAIYTYTLKNPGTRSFMDIRLVDNLCSPLILLSGNTVNPLVLDPGETWTFRCEQTLTKTTTNMAAVVAIFEMKVLASHLVSATVQRTATATVTVAPDTTPPTVTAFALPTMWGSLQVPIQAFTATDDVAVTGYMVTDTPTAPTPGHISWKPTPQTSFTFSSQGSKTLYAWAKDGAGNVSASLSASVVIQPLIEVPNVIGFMEHTARRKLADHNLKVGKRLSKESGSPTGTVISQNPTGHSPAHPSLVPPGTPVDLLISIAGPTGPGTVPNVVGMSIQEATETITNAGYIPSNAGTEPSDLAVGLVCRQNPEWGQAAAPGSTVSFWVTSNVPKYLYLDPPRATLKIGQQVSFTVTLVMKDGSNQVLTPNQVQWDPGPSNQFTCVKPGKFIVWARFGNAHGSATVTCEEDWSVPAFEPPVSSARDRDARVPEAGPGEYTWYAFCDPRSGEVTYGQQLPTGRKIMAGPFPGPRTAYDWIEKNCPRWRCTSDGQCATEPARAPGGAEGWYVLCERRSGSVVFGKNIDPTRYTVMAGPFLGEPDARRWTNQNCSNLRCDSNGICAKGPARGGEWKVLCGRNDLKIYIGKTYDSTKFILVQEGFLGEPDARAWANQNYPNWECTQSGGPVTAPRMGGRWAVVCSKQHGGVSLTQYPDRVNYYVWGEGFFGEPDARRWTDQNCPSWRCDAQGRCLTGVARRTPEGRPLEVPPEPGRERERTVSEEMRRKEEPPKKEYLSDAEVKAFQKELWDKYYQKWKDEWCINRPKRKKGSVNWSGCLEFPLNQLLGLQRTAWGARTRAKQNVVRKLAQCYDKCIMTDTPQPVLDKCIQDCIKQNPMPK